MKIRSEYFYGNKVSEYGLKNGYVDYATLAKTFDAVLANDIIGTTYQHGFFWEMVNGSDVSYYDDITGDWLEYEEIEDWENVRECFVDIFQYYIISEAGYKILEEFTNEIVYYNAHLDLYVWGVTHCGTGWSYVLTDIEIDMEV